MDNKQAPTFVDLAGMAVVSAVFVGGGVGIGYWIGSLTGASTVAVFVGLALGLGAAVAAMYVKIRSYL